MTACSFTAVPVDGRPRSYAGDARRIGQASNFLTISPKRLRLHSRAYLRSAGRRRWWTQRRGSGFSCVTSNPSCVPVCGRFWSGSQIWRLWERQAPAMRRSRWPAVFGPRSRSSTSPNPALMPSRRSGGYPLRGSSSRRGSWWSLPRTTATSSTPSEPAPGGCSSRAAGGRVGSCDAGGRGWRGVHHATDRRPVP